MRRRLTMVGTSSNGNHGFQVMGAKSKSATAFWCGRRFGACLKLRTWLRPRSNSGLASPPESQQQPAAQHRQRQGARFRNIADEEILDVRVCGIAANASRTGGPSGVVVPLGADFLDEHIRINQRG